MAADGGTTSETQGLANWRPANKLSARAVEHSSRGGDWLDFLRRAETLLCSVAGPTIVSRLWTEDEN